MEFTTNMSLSGKNTGIEVPAELIEQLGAGKKPPVVVTVRMNQVAHHSREKSSLSLKATV